MSASEIEGIIAELKANPLGGTLDEMSCIHLPGLIPRALLCMFMAGGM